MVVLFAAAVVASAAVAAGLAALLTNVQARKVEARDPYLKLVRVDEDTTDPAPWGVNWPRQYDERIAAPSTPPTRAMGGATARPRRRDSRRIPGSPAASRLEKDPWLARMFAGYAFALDFRERRGCNAAPSGASTS